jgi:hypothetical protein
MLSLNFNDFGKLIDKMINSQGAADMTPLLKSYDALRESTEF